MEEDPPGFAPPVPTYAHAQHVLEANPSITALVLTVPAVPAAPVAASPANDAAAQGTKSLGQKSGGEPIWQRHAKRSRARARYVRKVVEEKRMEALMEGMGGMKVESGADVQESDEGDEKAPPASPDTLARRRREQAAREERYWALCARQSYNQTHPMQLITDEQQQARTRRNRERKKKQRDKKRRFEAEERRNAMLPPLPPLPTYSDVPKKVQKKEPKKEKKLVQRTITQMFPKAKPEQNKITKGKKKGKKQDAAATRRAESLSLVLASAFAPTTADTPRLVRQSAFHEAEPEMLEGSLSTHMDVYVPALFASPEFELRAPRPSPELCAQTVSVSEWRARGTLQEMGDVERRFGGLSVGGGDVPQPTVEDMDDDEEL